RKTNAHRYQGRPTDEPGTRLRLPCRRLRGQREEDEELVCRPLRLALGLSPSAVHEVADYVEAALQAHLVDLVVLHDALDIIARFGEGDALDPVDHRVDILAARVAIALNPFPGAPGACIVA